jgi:membrane protease YdiL (CAAX protease family)
VPEGEGNGSADLFGDVLRGGSKLKLKSNFYAPILFGVILLLTGISSVMTRSVASISQNPFLSTTIIQLLVYFLPLAFYCRVRGLNLVNAVKINYVSPKKISFLVILAGILVMGILLFRYFGLFFFDLAFVDTPSAIFIPAESQNGFLVLFCNVLLPAVLEESLFCGLILDEYRSYGSFFSVAVSSLMFAMVHGSLENFLFYLFVGAMFAIITLVSNSLVPALICHIGLNYSYFYFRPMVVAYLRQAGKSPLLPYLLMAGFILIFVFLFSRLEGIYRDKVYDEMLSSRKELLRKELESARETAEPAEGGKENPALTACREIFLSPSFLISLVIFIALVLGLFA